MAKKKSKRKNPKRVAAGKKAARARWGKGRSKKASKKSRKKRSVGLSRIENAVEKVLSKHYTVALDGSRHSISFPGHGKATKKAGKRKSRKPASPAQLLARARFAAMAKARAAARKPFSRLKKAKHGVEPRYVAYGYTGE